MFHLLELIHCLSIFKGKTCPSFKRKKNLVPKIEILNHYDSCNSIVKNF